MPGESVVERLTKLNPETEIWWDSSPLVYASWKKKMLSEAPPEKRTGLEAQLTRFFNEDDPAKSLIRGVTTNPPISLKAIQGRPDIWLPWVDELIKNNPYAGEEVIFWQTYIEIVRRGSEMMMPIWEASGHRYGYLSGQVDPRFSLNEELMFKQAMEIAAQNPNVMVKCPGTAEGIRLLRRLTTMGIATNCTVAFVVPQFISVAEAIKSGLKEAKENNIDMYRWRSVITHMAARYEERPEFDQSASQAGISLSLEDKRWASIGIFRKGYEAVKRRNYPGKMLFCSIRPGPVVDGVEHIWHIEQVAGGSMVYTLPPDCLSYLWAHEKDLEFKPVIEEPVPPATLEKLMKVPYFAEAYAEEMDPARYAELASTVFTTMQFSEATEKMITFVRERISTVRGTTR